MLFIRYLLITGSICLLLIVGGCSGSITNNIPADFVLIVDADSAVRDVENINIQISAKGKGRYQCYNTRGAIRFDTTNMITYKPDQVTATGEFRVEQKALEKLWKMIEENHFFKLSGDYTRSIGLSYGFIVVRGEGRKHQVFNIGMEVPEIRAIIEATNKVLPKEIGLVYRKGYLSEKAY